jgi:tight adherence protein B
MSDKALFLLMVFIVVLLLSQAFVSPLMGSSAQAKRRLRGRIRDLSAKNEEAQPVSLVRQKYLKKLSPLARKIESLPSLTPLNKLIEQAGYEYFAHQVLLVGLGAGVVAAVIGGLVLGWGIPALLAGLLGAALPFLFLQRRRLKRLAKFEEQLPDALAVMARSLQAGLPFSEAMNIVAQEMEEPVSQEFATVFTEINFGGNVRTALLGLLERMPTVAVMAVVSSIMIQRETGGNLAEVMDRIANLVRQRFRFQRSVRTLTAEGRMTAWVVSLMPFLLGGGMALLSPEWIENLTQNPAGRQMMIGAFIVMVVGILWIRRLIRIDV